jgi:response regulator NasT
MGGSMESALIVSCSDKSIDFFDEMLKMASVKRTETAQSCEQARETLESRDYDVVIINAPLRDETGEKLSKQIASKGTTQVILVVKSEYFDEISVSTESTGVLTVSKPVNRALFWSALRLAKSAIGRVRLVREENDRLKRKLEDISIVSRAKLLLITYLGLSEQEAHRYIEKQAMDLRRTKREIAEDILKTYEN